MTKQTNRELPPAKTLHEFAGRLDGLALILREYGCLPEAINAECLALDLTKLAEQANAND